MSLARIGGRTALVAAGALVSVALMAAPSWARSAPPSSAPSSLVSSPTTSSAELTLTLSPEEGLTGALFTGETNHYIYVFSITPSEHKPTEPKAPLQTQTFTVTNKGTGTSQSLVDTFVPTSGGAMFALSNDKCSGKPLASGQSCTFQLSEEERSFGLLEVSGSAGAEYIRLLALA